MDHKTEPSRTALEAALHGDEDNQKEISNPRKKRKVIAKKQKLGKQTKKAVKEAKAAHARWDNIDLIPEEERKNGIVLDDETGLRLSPIFSKVLKPHQRVGVRFLWSHVKKENGCILADYMGLGKTIQTISLMHTYFVDYRKKNGCRPLVLIVAPTSVIHNWRREIFKWLDRRTAEGVEALDMFNMRVMDSKIGGFWARQNLISQWVNDGGLLIMGYEMLRSLTQATLYGKHGCGSVSQPNQSQVDVSHWLTSKPGANLVIVDEGHRLRHDKSLLVKAMTQLNTPMKIVLTGYPLQNHLLEYFCMVDFARKGFLGSKDQFKHRFIIPIENGSASDSDMRDVKLARKRTYVLNEILRSLVLRRDSSLLAKELPPKYEWVVQCRLTATQSQLYRQFVRHKCSEAERNGSANGNIIGAYHNSLSIVNHPDILFRRMRLLQNGGVAAASFQDDKEDWDDGICDDMLDGMLETGENFDSTCPIIYSFEPRSPPPIRLREALVDDVVPNRDNGSSSSSSSSSSVPGSTSRRVVYIAYVQPSTLASSYLDVYDEITELDGVPLNGSVQKFKSILAQSANKANIKLEGVRYLDKQSAVYKQLEKLTVGENHNDGVMGVQSMSAAHHALGWAEPIFRDYKARSALSGSGKMQVLFSILRYCRSHGDKVLVFSQSVKTLDVIQRIIDTHNSLTRRALANDNNGAGDDDEAEGSDTVPFLRDVMCGYARLDGKTPQTERTPIVDHFNKAPISEAFVFLASTRAAGEGLNLQSANRVVMFDACWNPCLDHEAMCRAYRFGQTKPTFVYRLVAAGTMERTIFDRQSKKEGLVSRVVDARATKRTVAAQDLRDFFNLKKFNLLQKEKIAKKTIAAALAKDDDGEEEEEEEDPVSGSGGKDNLKTTTEPIGGEKVKQENSDSEAAKTDAADDEIVITDLPTDENELQRYRALKKDLVLQDVLNQENQMVTAFKLEDLLIDEDEDASEQARAEALAEWRKEREMENELVSKGYTAAAAAAAVAAQNRPQAHGQYQQTQQSYPSSALQAHPQRQIFQGRRFLILRRRMPTEVFDSLRVDIGNNGGEVYLELPTPCHFVISTWNTAQLENWKNSRREKLEANNKTPSQIDEALAFTFKTPDFITLCLQQSRICSDGGDNPSLEQVQQQHSAQSTTTLKPSVTPTVIPIL